MSGKPGWKAAPLAPLLMAGTALTGCQQAGGMDWYGYRLGDRLDAADIVGIPVASNGSRTVTLKPKGAWPWDEAKAWVDPAGIIIALDFEMIACEASQNAAHSLVPSGPPRCNRSEQQMAAFASTLRDTIRQRVSPHVLPDHPVPPPGFNPPLHPVDWMSSHWSFRKTFSGCNGHTPLYRAPYDEPTGSVDSISLMSDRHSVSLMLSIADMARHDSVRQSIVGADDETERQKHDDSCIDRHVRYVTISRGTPASFLPQYGRPEADGYKVPPFKRAGVITSEDYDHAAAPGGPESEVNWVDLAVRLDLDATGKLDHCAIEKGSGIAGLDALSCRLVMQRFRFYPARQEDGTPVPARVSYGLSWPLPRFSNGDAWDIAPQGSPDERGSIRREVGPGGDTRPAQTMRPDTGRPMRPGMGQTMGPGMMGSAYPRPRSPHIKPAIPLNRGSWNLIDAYPEEAKGRHEQGVVKVDLTVSADGLPMDCSVVRSSNWPDLDDATCGYLSAHARYKPATDNAGNPVASHTQQQVRWSDPFR